MTFVQIQIPVKYCYLYKNMSFNLKVEGIVGSFIFTERNIIDWNEYKTSNFCNLDFIILK
jgi:hypothetical protein